MYKAVSPLKHNGVMFNAGDVVEGLTEDEAKKLVADGVVAEANKSSKVEKQTAQENRASEVSNKMNKTTLLAIAAEKGVTADETMTKNEIVAAIQAAA